MNERHGEQIGCCLPFRLDLLELSRIWAACVVMVLGFFVFVFVVFFCVFFFLLQFEYF